MSSIIVAWMEKHVLKYVGLKPVFIDASASSTPLHRPPVKGRDPYLKTIGFPLVLVFSNSPPFAVALHIEKVQPYMLIVQVVIRARNGKILHCRPKENKRVTHGAVGETLEETPSELTVHQDYLKSRITRKP